MNLGSTIGFDLCRLNYVIHLLLSDGELGVIWAAVVLLFHALHLQSVISTAQCHNSSENSQAKLK